MNYLTPNLLFKCATLYAVGSGVYMFAQPRPTLELFTGDSFQSDGAVATLRLFSIVIAGLGGIYYAVSLSPSKYRHGKAHFSLIYAH
jgi:hypothetical protein